MESTNQVFQQLQLIIERFKNEKFLEELDRELFIVPAEMTAGQLQNVIRQVLSAPFVISQ